MRPTTYPCSAALAAVLLVIPVTTRAGETAKPAFDCARADSSVTRLVCADAALAALDRKLDDVYKAAVAKSNGETLATLKAEQRGWVKGRDECWKAQKKAPTWLTESFVVDDIRACTEWSYSQRIAELQVMWQLVPSKPAVSYACNGNPANEVIAQLFDTALPAGRFERGDQTVVGYLVKSPDGMRYEGRNMRFAASGKDAKLRWRGEDLACKAR